jgi:hypothetical protein
MVSLQHLPECCQGDYSNFDTRYLGISANAASASKLVTSRKIAGKAF